MLAQIAGKYVTRSFGKGKGCKDSFGVTGASDSEGPVDFVVVTKRAKRIAKGIDEEERETKRSRIEKDAKKLLLTRRGTKRMDP